jgi:HAE1 family hydrophobic/amphiphilic exporter-1
MTANGFSSGQSLQTMDDLTARSLPPGMKAEWTAMSYQEKLAGSSAYIVFALGILLVYLVLAGQYGSWVTPAAVIFGVPLALLGTGAALLALGVANIIYTQIGLVLLIALSAKNAIPIVEVARELHEQGHSITDAAVGAAQKRFRPIVMTCFAFILGVVPLVLATGAGAPARKSIGIAVFSGMLAPLPVRTTHVFQDRSDRLFRDRDGARVGPIESDDHENCREDDRREYPGHQ